ncbi:hypothetical protein PV327_009997 [Microctonus hyperodae]|uniref:Uncharacterized protein n=1 Tax=Microctonus hyperodae TaxID=165561 RepID=A0AA39F250_MICHY|nr:hypothetical protein PV327_009997 [Microctonus hyperodae]
MSAALAVVEKAARQQGLAFNPSKCVATSIVPSGRDKKSSGGEEGQPVLGGGVTTNHASTPEATAAPQDLALLPGNQILPSSGSVELHTEGPTTT